MYIGGSTSGQKGFFQSRITQNQWQVQVLNGVQDQMHLKTHNNQIPNQNPKCKTTQKAKTPKGYLALR